MPDLSRKPERERLAVRHTPYFQRIGRRAFLGIRRGSDSLIGALDPITAAAQTGTNVAMIEKAYLRFIPSAMQEKLVALKG